MDSGYFIVSLIIGESKMELVQKLQTILDEATASGIECGCQLAVYQNGKPVCDLCSGYTDGTHSQKIGHNTLFPIFSVGKGIVTTLIHILAERGILAYDDLVTKYWKEYGCRGKEKTTVENILTHRAGLFSVPEQLSFDEWFDWRKITSALAEAEPQDKIGGIHHYHAHTYGALTGHLAELAAGRPFRTLLSEEILKPLKIDSLFFGIPEERYGDLAKIEVPDPEDMRVKFNRHSVLSGLNPSSSGSANALSIARFYASLIGDGVDGVRLLKPETVNNAVSHIRRSADDPVKPEAWDKFGLGYALCGPAGNPGRMFGHGGAAGSEGFADRETGYAVGFTKNRVTPDTPDITVRNRISEALGIPKRVW